MKYSIIEKIPIVDKTTGAKWVDVYFDNGTVWRPALWEQAFLMQQVVVCERAKYGDLTWKKGPDWDAGDMPIRFISRAGRGENIEMLCRLQEFNLADKNSFRRLAEVIRKSKEHDERTVVWDFLDGRVC